MKKKTTTKKKTATKLSSNWSSTPPAQEGYWWTRSLKHPGTLPILVEVQRESNPRSKKMLWSFLGGLTWNACTDYPSYFWAGPVLPPE